MQLFRGFPPITEQGLKSIAREKGGARQKGHLECRWRTPPATMTHGGRYEGGYKDDKFHGIGQYTWADGRRWRLRSPPP